MDFTTRTDAAGLHVSLRGRFTFADHQSFRDLIATFQGYRGKTVVLDMAGLEFIDSAAMGMLLLARETAVSNGINTVIRNASGKVRSLMQVARFDQLFSVE